MFALFDWLIFVLERGRVSVLHRLVARFGGALAGALALFGSLALLALLALGSGGEGERERFYSHFLGDLLGGVTVFLSCNNCQLLQVFLFELLRHGQVRRRGVRPRGRWDAFDAVNAVSFSFSSKAG